MSKRSWVTSWTKRKTRPGRFISQHLHVDRLEDRTVPTSGDLLVTGAGATGGPHVKVFDASTGALKFEFAAYDPSFTGGVRVAAADVTGDGVPDIVTGPGPGGGPVVRVFDGLSHQLVRQFNAFDPSFRGGVTLAAADFTGDGKADIAVAPDVGGGPVVRLFNGATSAMITEFLAYDANFRGGLNLAVGDVTGDGVADIVTGAGFGGGPHVKVFDGSRLPQAVVARQFFAYDTAFRGGVFVAASAPQTTGGAGEVITGPGVGGGPHVKVFDVSGANVTTTASFLAFPATFAGGVRVAAADVNGDGNSDVVIGAGRDDSTFVGVGPRVVLTTLAGALIRTNLVYDSAFRGGIYAAGTSRDQAVPPQGTFSASPANEGGAGQVTFSNVTGGSGGYLFSYDFDNNGTFEVVDTASTSVAVPASFLNDGPGSRTVHGRIRDSHGAFADRTAVIAVANVPPTVQASGPYTGAPGAAINFVATVSDPSSVDTAAGFTYLWDFGDGSTSTQSSPNHIYTTAGLYPLTVTARDKDGGTGTSTAVVTVGTVSNSFIVTPYDRIPNFGASPNITAAQSGNWTDVNTWSLGRLPVAGDVVSIGNNVTVTYDLVSDVALDTVAIQAGGSLVFRTDVNTRLTVVNLLVMQGGTLQVGTVANPVAAGVKAEIIIPDLSFDLLQDPAQYGHGLIALGKVTMSGAPLSDTFVRLATEPHAGDATLTLATPVTGWRVGDRLVLPDTRQLNLAGNETGTGFVGQWELTTISAIAPDGLHLTLSQPLVYNHLGSHDENGNVEFLAHVGDITRNVVLRSASNLGTRGHTFFSYRADVAIAYTQFAGLGRTRIDPLDSTTFDASGNVTHVGTNETGRYAVNFAHLFGPTAGQGSGYQYSFVGNSVVCQMNPQPFRWGIDLNGSSYGLLQDNVVYNWAGGGIVGETGTESDNVIDHNFVVRIISDTNTVDSGWLRADRRGLSDIATEGVAFWFRGFNNYVRNNVASDATSYGYTYFAEFIGSGGHVRIPLFPGADPGVDGQYQDVNMNDTPLLQFSGNEAYGAMPAGMTIWWLGTFGLYPYADAAQSVIQDFRVWNAHEQGFFGYETNRLKFDGITVRGNFQWLAGGGSGLYGITSGDYFTKDLVISHADIRGALVGFAPSYLTGGGTQTIENSYLRNYYNVMLQPMLTSNYHSDWLPARTTIIDNVIFATPAISDNSNLGPKFNICMRGQQSGDVINYIQSDQLFVYNYNGVGGDNFQVYYQEQRPDFVLPQSTYNPDGTTRITACPVAGLTNAQAWMTYGIAFGGCVSPTSATRTGIYGFVRAI